MNDFVTTLLAAHYPAVGTVRELTSGGGTAGKCWRVTAADNRRYLLRRRGARTSDPRLVERDHRFREFLLHHGLPTTLPVAARDGRRFVQEDGAVYELHPFVAGRFIDTGSETELRELARVLAEFHRVTRQWRPKMEKLSVCQFEAAIPGGAAPSTRLDDPAAMLSALEHLAADTGVTGLHTVLGLARNLAEEYRDEIYAEVDCDIIHGDLNFSNLLFDENGRVAGIFDFDWTMPGARIRDIADALHFFAGGLPADADCGNIWDLTQLPRFHAKRTRIFLETYERLLPLSDREKQLLPAAWKTRVLAFHIEGMAKVPPERRLEFLTRDFPEFLDALQRLLPVN